MPDFDWNIIYAPDTAENRAAATLRQEATALKNDLANGDFAGAAAVLKQAGSCNWHKLIPESSFQIIGKDGYEDFVVNYSENRQSSTIQLSQKVDNSVLWYPSVNYLPRVTVTDNSCR
jgi:hypothetical protein